MADPDRLVLMLGAVVALFALVHTLTLVWKHRRCRTRGHAWCHMDSGEFQCLRCGRWFHL